MRAAAIALASSHPLVPGLGERDQAARTFPVHVNRARAGFRGRVCIEASPKGLPPPTRGNPSISETLTRPKNHASQPLAPSVPQSGPAAMEESAGHVLLGESPNLTSTSYRPITYVILYCMAFLQLFMISLFVVAIVRTYPINNAGTP